MLSSEILGESMMASAMALKAVDGQGDHEEDNGLTADGVDFRTSPVILRSLSTKAIAVTSVATITGAGSLSQSFMVARALRPAVEETEHQEAKGENYQRMTKAIHCQTA